MTVDELAAYLRTYDAWRPLPPKGWESMIGLPVEKAYMVEVLFPGGRTEWWPVSNAQFVTSPLHPLAWRKATSRSEWQRKLAHAWIDKADIAGVYMIIRAIAKYEHELEEQEKAA